MSHARRRTFQAKSNMRNIAILHCIYSQYHHLQLYPPIFAACSSYIMTAPRSATVITPAFMRAVAARQLRQSSGPLSRRTPAIAILVPRRSQSTDTSSSSNTPNNFPPPGYNSEQAKKPLSSKDQQTDGSKAAQSAEADKAKETPFTAAANRLQKGTLPSEIGSHKPTALPKTDASDARSLNELSAEESTAVEAKAALGKDVDKKEAEKLSLWGKVKKEAAHYWDGTKLLAAEVKISTRLALKMAGGYELTRRENRQVRSRSYCIDSSGVY